MNLFAVEKSRFIRQAKVEMLLPTIILWKSWGYSSKKFQNFQFSGTAKIHRRKIDSAGNWGQENLKRMKI